jgi:hypothetical protein
MPEGTLIMTDTARENQQEMSRFFNEDDILNMTG